MKLTAHTSGLSSAIVRWLFPSCVRPLKQSNDRPIIICEPIHEWFGLSYAHYLTIPRSVLQSMPDEWQQRFVECLEELDRQIDWRPEEGCYWVKLRDAHGRFVFDPFGEYRHAPKLPLRS